MFSGFSTIFTLVLAILPTIRVAAQAPPPSGESVTFNSIPNFTAVRNCATCCFGQYGGCYFNSEITKVVGCSLNSCICSRTDIRSIITAHLESCVSQSCSSVSGDVTIALSVFNAYCEDYFGAGVDAGATPSDGDGGGVSPVTVTETQTIPLSTLTTTLEIATVQVAATTITVFPDQNSPNNRDSANTVTVTAAASSGLSDNTKIGLGVGLGIGIPIVAAALFVAYRFSKALTAPPEMPQPIQGSYVG